MDLPPTVTDFVRDHGAKLTAAVSWLGLGWLYFRRRSEWARKEFRQQVNFSLNYLIDGKLAMRTLLELPARDVWLNDRGVKLVLAAAGKTTADDPFLTLPDPADAAFLDRAALNVLSEKFADVFLAQSIGLPVTTTVYRFAVTCERFEVMRTVKLRVLVAREADLDGVFDPAHPQHPVVQADDVIMTQRLRTLVAMHRRHKKGDRPLGWVELGLRI
jgi:hypothetical protein